MKHPNNILAWSSMRNYIYGKGLIIFSSIELIELYLFMTTLFSYLGCVSTYLFKINKDKKTPRKDEPPISSSASFDYWLFFVILCTIFTFNFLYIGYKFQQESHKQISKLHN